MPSNYINYLVFLVSPILALVNVLANWRTADCRNIVWLFAGFYGLAFYIAPDSSTDCVRYRDWFIQMHESDLNFETLKGSFYQEGENHYDLYQPLLTFFLSRFTDDSRVLFGAVGFVFGFFYSRVIFFFVDKLAPTAGWLELFLIVSLAFVLDMGAAINGFRMWTALFVFLLGALYYWDRRQPLFLLLAAASILFHFAYAIPVAILLATTALRPFISVIYFFFLASFIMTTVDVGLIRNFVESLGLGFESRVGGYLNEFDPSLNETPRIIIINKWMMHAFAVCSVTSLYLTTQRMKVSHLLLQGLTFAMLMYGAVNILSEVGSIGRFYSLCKILIIGLLLLMIIQHHYLPNIRQSVSAIASLLILNTALGIRFTLGFASINLLVGNPLTIWFFDFAEHALYDYLPPIFRGL